ncbi:hypothetical protein KDH_32360 [Dictyobacter sp. S3.2.2.5]|uniref:AB hydrolase-1 domain-containing protein n=1 Tax=Dictyobacter halimunensis TaxID=3026934 RepID=A0ABQ6FVD0_9CHLR|nr:hypothetical protein KDH_32360 [Dictyobacter sp. S3.2.2.5]
MLKSLRLLFLCALLITLAACTTQEATQPSAIPNPTPTPAVSPTATIPAIASSMVHFKTSDNVTLAGSLYKPQTTSTSKSSKIFVICSHEMGRTKEIWKDSGMPQRLAALGYYALAYDFRGNGDSEGAPDTSILDTDLKAALAFVQTQGAEKVVLLGSSMGGTASLKVAAHTNVAAVITLSSPEMFSTEVTDADVKAIKAPKLFINSEGDSYVDDTTHMHQVAGPPKEIHIYPGNQHGIAIFGTENSADLTQRLLTFTARYAPLS